MSRLLNTLRTHPKKSVFFSLAAAYGANLAKGKYEERLLMRRLCAEAAAMGTAPHQLQAPLYNVTVILNPAAAGGGARKKFEKYCAPILHLAGLKVSVVRTEGEGQAKDLMEIMKDADAVLVAGGDGTVMEAVTGLMRRKDVEELRRSLPLGVLPVGKNNRLAKSLFPAASEEGEVSLMAHAAMSCVKQLYRPMDVMQVENIGDDEEIRGKKIYGLGDLQIGAYKDAHDRMPKYWYWAGLDKLMTYVFSFTTSAKHLMWSCSGELEVAQGFSEVMEEPEQAVAEKPAESKRWWQGLLSWGRGGGGSNKVEATPRVNKIFEWVRKAEFTGLELSIQTPNLIGLGSEQVEGRKLNLVTGPNEIGFFDFVKEGYRREKCSSVKESLPGGLVSEGEESAWNRVATDAVRFCPSPDLSSEEKPATFNLDNEHVDINGAFEVSLLTDQLVMFCAPEIKIEMDTKGEPVNSNSTRPWWQRSSSSSPSSTVQQPQQMSAIKPRGF